MEVHLEPFDVKSLIMTCCDTVLGLPIAKRWAELLGESIRVASELGKGSTVTVRIPVGGAQ